MNERLPELRQPFLIAETVNFDVNPCIIAWVRVQ